MLNKIFSLLLIIILLVSSIGVVSANNELSLAGDWRVYSYWSVEDLETSWSDSNTLYYDQNKYISIDNESHIKHPLRISVSYWEFWNLHKDSPSHQLIIGAWDGSQIKVDTNIVLRSSWRNGIWYDTKWYLV
jgi:hypothetical protein